MSDFSRSLSAPGAAKCIINTAFQLDLIDGPIAIAPELAEAEKSLIVRMLAEIKRRCDGTSGVLQPDEISSLFTFAFAKSAEAVTNFYNHQENKFELTGLLDGRIPVYADDKIMEEFKSSPFPFTCAQNYLQWCAENPETVDTADPLLLLFEALKWCFRLGCHMAVTIVEDKENFELDNDGDEL